MGTYRLFPSTNGPANAVSWNGNFISGVAFMVTQGGMWFQGFYYWVAGGSPAGPTAAQRFALWALTAPDAGTVVPGSVVTSGTLTAGAWNYVPLGTPIQLSIGASYVAATGVNGNFSDTVNSFGSGQTYVAGITNGPLQAFSDSSGSNIAPYSQQGVFATTGSDPSVTLPGSGDSTSDNFWVDVQVSDTAPAGYSGSYRLWPNNYDANPSVAPDTAVNYDVATEVHLSQACALNKVWFYSPSGATNLPTMAQVWSIVTGATVASNASPKWSGGAGSGWVSCSFSNITLQPGKYKVSVFNSAGTLDGWSPKTLYYWNAEGQGLPFYDSAGANGITNGPLSAPNQVSASTAYEYDGSNAGSAPPYSSGVTEPGQSTFGQTPGGTDIYPQIYVDGLAQNYWVDIEVTPSAASPSPTPTPTSTSTSPLVTYSGAFLPFFP